MSTAVVDHVRMMPRLGVDAWLYVMEGTAHVAHGMAVDTPAHRPADGDPRSVTAAGHKVRSSDGLCAMRYCR